METIITKKTKIYEVNNDKCWNFYYLINFRCINEENTRYKRGKFIIWFDIFDIQEHFDSEKGITKAQFNEYVEELAYNFMYDINYDNFGEHIPKMKETFDNYNN